MVNVTATVTVTGTVNAIGTPCCGTVNLLIKIHLQTPHSVQCDRPSNRLLTLSRVQSAIQRPQPEPLTPLCYKPLQTNSDHTLYIKYVQYV